LCPRIVNLLRENGMEDTLVLVGGIVPQEDIQTLKANGVSEIFLPALRPKTSLNLSTRNVRFAD
jgi:methylmalonyl-CoA mutase C-terminal domain/subunit